MRTAKYQLNWGQINLRCCKYTQNRNKNTYIRIMFLKKLILQRKEAFNPKMQENKFFLELKNT